jgi:hypothetical protein
MTSASALDRVDQMIVDFLHAQRARALAVVAGLDAEQLATPVLPSGWTPLGMIEHLGHAERHWFQKVALGAATAPPPAHDAPEGDEAADVGRAADADGDGPFVATRDANTVFAFYRAQIERANEVLATTPLSTPPLGRHSQRDSGEVVDLRFIVLHMIEETARHLGHLDAARELIDGRVGLGQDEL